MSLPTPVYHIFLVEELSSKCKRSDIYNLQSEKRGASAKKLENRFIRERKAQISRVSVCLTRLSNSAGLSGHWCRDAWTSQEQARQPASEKSLFQRFEHISTTTRRGIRTGAETFLNFTKFWGECLNHIASLLSAMISELKFWNIYKCLLVLYKNAVFTQIQGEVSDVFNQIEQIHPSDKRWALLFKGVL